ncbi:MAG: ATP-binding cassette domain-containing protein, partial [Bacteroidales bacterium]|nr:ATP-binding cassette domain-containing protein [Bacteroidales bacterium]
PGIKNTIETETYIEGSITFKNVSFTYPDTNINALKNVSFNLKKGETLAILGKTGSGKSTILDLIGRLYDINEGSILIDNTSIERVNLNSLRNSIGYVPQDAFLFSDTIKNNIRFGKENATEQEVVQAAKNAYIHHNIIHFKEGYETLVGERGVTLSGGQKQRISIARAIIRKPKILIFDDCLSAVDTETEEHLLTNLKNHNKEQTQIYISHRVSTIRNADNIFVIDQGEIIESGSHKDLVEKGGLYTELFEQQLVEESQLNNDL